MPSAPPVWVRRTVIAVAMAALLAGTLARFSHLNSELFWQDEAISALRVTGHTVAELDSLFDDRAHTVLEVATLQRIEPGRGIAATWSSFAAEEPQRGLPYYLASRLWVGVFGTSVTAFRAFSATIGLAGIVLAFFLGRAATRSEIGGFILAALIAISPFHIHYSEQVREYVLLADCILAASWALLAALEHPSAFAWIAFSATSAVGLYLGLEFVPILAGFAAIAAIGRPWDRARTGAFALACLAALILYLPWAVVNFNALEQSRAGVAWAATPYTISAFLLKWAFNTGATFFDAELADRRWAIAMFPLFALVIYGAIVAARRARKGFRGSQIALALAACTSLPLILIDTLRQSHYEAVMRYQVATWIGFELLATVGIVALLGNAQRRAAVAGLLVFSYTVACGVISGVISARYGIWWDNNQSVSEASAANAIPSRPTPTIIAERGRAVSVLVLSRYLAESDRLLLLGTETVPAIRRAQPAYALLPSASLLYGLRLQGRVENVSPKAGSIVPQLAQNSASTRPDPGNSLWRVTLPPSFTH